MRENNGPTRFPGSGGEAGFPLMEVMNDISWLRRREMFYEKALGTLRQPGVYHWEDDGDPHVDVYVIGRGPGRDHETLITGGLADRPMPGVPAGAPRPRRVEALIHLARAEDWAAMILREIAWMPFLYGMTLEEGRVVHGARRICEGSKLQHAVLRKAEDPGLSGFVVDGDEVAFLRACFVTDRELQYAMQRGTPALLEALDRAGVGPVLDPRREPVV